MSDKSWLRDLRTKVGATRQPWKFLFGVLYGATLALTMLFLFTAILVKILGFSPPPFWAYTFVVLVFASLVGISE